MPKFGDIISTVLDEAHKTRYSVHPDSNKMYEDLKKNDIGVPT